MAEEVLGAPQVISEAQDGERLYEQALEEQAAALQQSSSVAELVNKADDPYRQLLDLSLVDERFAPALVEVTLNHLVQAWEGSMIQGDASLTGRATADAINQLRRPVSVWDGALFILRDAALESWEVQTLRAVNQSVEIEVALNVVGVRYLVRPNTGQRGKIGANDLRHEINLRWTLTATGHADPSWMLTASSTPAADIPGAMY